MCDVFGSSYNNYTCTHLAVLREGGCLCCVSSWTAELWCATSRSRTDRRRVGLEPGFEVYCMCVRLISLNATLRWDCFEIFPLKQLVKWFIKGKWYTIRCVFLIPLKVSSSQLFYRLDSLFEFFLGAWLKLDLSRVRAPADCDSKAFGLSPLITRWISLRLRHDLIELPLQISEQLLPFIPVCHFKSWVMLERQMSVLCYVFVFCSNDP